MEASFNEKNHLPKYRRPKILAGFPFCINS